MIGSIALILIVQFAVFGQGDPCASNFDAAAQKKADQLLIKTPPTDAVGYVLQGYALRRLGQYELAEKYATKAMDLDPKYAPAYYLSGELHDHRSSWGWAALMYSKAIALYPDSSDLYYARGRVRINREEFMAAISDVTKSIELDPKNAQAFYARGYVHRYRGDRERMKADLDTAYLLVTDQLKTAPSEKCTADLLLVRALIYDSYGDTGRSIDDLTESIKLDSTNSELFYYRGRLFAKLKKYDEAIESLTTAIKLDPNYALSFRERAKTYDALGFKKLADADRATFESLGSFK